MKAVTVWLSDHTIERLRKEARVTGRSMSAMIRDCVENERDGKGRSVYDLSADLVGSLRGSRRPATNDRPKFRR